MRSIFRRQLLLGASISLLPIIPEAAAQSQLDLGQLRGVTDAENLGVSPESNRDQSTALQKAINETASNNELLFLPAGDYFVSNIEFPENTRIFGVTGASRLIYTGRGHGFRARNINRLMLRDISFDGALNPFSDYAKGLLHIANCANLSLKDVAVSNSAAYGIYLEGCGGKVAQCDVSRAREAGIYAVQSTRLDIQSNHIYDCGNGGILVHRWEIGPDNSTISNNRISNIAATNGGTGQFGNGINIYRAGNVLVSDNHISDCAFSAIRANSASNINISDNTCLGSGETALYVEFAFQGAVVSGNLVDGGTMGISIANLDSGGRLSTISGNLIRNISDEGPYPPEGPGFGIGIAAEADVSVTGNTIENVAKWGMLLGWGPFLRSVNINGNVIRKVPTGIAVTVVDGAKSTAISNNIFSDVTQGAIIGYEWVNSVTKELGQPNANQYPHLKIANNLIN